jgi:hypothetical protein
MEIKDFLFSWAYRPELETYTPSYPVDIKSGQDVKLTIRPIQCQDQE